MQIPEKGFPGLSGDSEQYMHPSEVNASSGQDSPIFLRKYAWKYQGEQWKIILEIPRDVYDADRGSSHERVNDYAPYVFSARDQPYIKKISEQIRSLSLQKGYGNDSLLFNTISFVQSLPSISDAATTGYDDYARYPVETLVDGGGDCEDTAILAAALLNEMGYQTAFIIFPTHVALGLKAEKINGTYYESGKIRYYYLETTGEGYTIGQVPESFVNMRALIVPVIRKPQLLLNMTVTTGKLENDLAWVEIQGFLSNTGTDIARNPRLTLALLDLEIGDEFIWNPPTTIQFIDISEETPGVPFSTRMMIPANCQSQVRAIVEGDNFETNISYSVRFET